MHVPRMRGPSRTGCRGDNDNTTFSGYVCMLSPFISQLAVMRHPSKCNLHII